MNGDIKHYIQEALKSGQSKNQIRQALLDAGWREDDIIESFNSLKISESAPTKTQPKIRKKITDIFNFLNYFKRPKIYLIGCVILLLAGALFFYYQKIVLKEEISEFELAPKVFDAAGIPSTTTFILRSTADLSAAVIERYLQFEPHVDYAVKKIGSGSSVFEITPNSALEENKVYSIKIAEGPIAARTYSWAYQVKAPFQVISTLPRDKTNSVPTNTGIEITFNRENLINPQDSFEISPSVPGKFEIHRNILVFVPLQELAPKTVYAIKIKSGIKAQGSDDALSEDTEIKFETGEKYTYQPRPYFNFDKTFWEFKPDTEAAFEVYYSNLFTNNVPLTVYRFNSLEEFIDTYKSSLDKEYSWTQHHGYKPATPSSDKKIFESSVPLEEQARVRFIRVPQKLSEGYYLADVMVNNEHKQAWFQVTQIASFSAISNTKILLWFKDLSNGNNLQNVEVFFEGKNLGRTNSDGVAMFNTPTPLIRGKDESNYYYYAAPLVYFYTATVNEKKIAIPIENEYGYFSKVSPPDSWWDYISIDKSVYLPTDKVHFWGIVRQRNGSDIKGEEITIQLTNQYWYGSSRDDITVYGETKAVISDFYTVTGEISFTDLKPRFYQLSVRRGDEVIVSENVNIETYIKPAYKLSLVPDKNAVFAGDTITYKVRAEFFDGTPVSNLRIKYNGYFDRQIADEVQLNQDGENSFTVKTDYQESQYSYWPRYLGMNISPAVSEEGEIDSNISVLVFGPHIDLKSEQSFSDKTSKFNLKLKKVVLDKVQKGEPYWYSENYLGDPVLNWIINVDVTEIIYRQTEIDKGYDIINKVTYPIYSYSKEERPVKQEILTTDGVGNAYFEWTPEEKKIYRITFTTRDTEGKLVKRQHFVYGGSFSYFGFYDARGVTIKNLDEKNEYKLGEQIRLQMQDTGGNALAPASGRFVFIRINNGIASYQITDSPDYTDFFQDSYIPNVQIMGIWFSGSRFNNTYSINLSFDSDERRLNIEVTKDKERYRPRDKVTLGIKVTDKNGLPKQAEVNVASIDEAIFALRPDEKDITNNLYRDIFPSLVTRSSHLTPLEYGAEGGGCFVSGTKVLTPTGLKNIEEFRVGDEILTREKENSSKIISTRVKRVSSHLVDGYLTINGHLNITTNHRLLINGIWKHAGEIKIGDILLDTDGNLEKVNSVIYVPEWLIVYNIELENYHTFFADGIYVHNEEKGGGGARADFRDVAIYKSVVTNLSGHAEVSFDVPDNLTSWRITTQAVTKDLFAGKNVSFVPVGLPFFVETALNRTYLTGDNLILRARVFGTASIQNNIAYTIESETLPFKKIEKVGDKIIEMPLGNLIAGQHQIKISAEGNDYKDSIIRDIVVLDSYFTQSTSEFYELSSDLTDIKGAAKGFTTLFITSYERGKFYQVLYSLLYNSSGARIDQKLSAELAKLYLNRFFGEKNEITEIDVRSYQTYDGGITLLPYSDKDLTLSAKFANLIADESVGVDKESLKGYLRTSLDDRKADLRRIAVALYGLSVFDEPILITLQNIKSDRNLTLLDKIYIAFALDNLGAKEEARNYYKAEIKPDLVTKKPFIFVNKLSHQDDNILATVLLAGLTASLSEPESDGLGQYAIEHYPKETLKNFEIVIYLKKVLPTLKGGNVGFSYRTSVKSESKTLKKDEVFKLELSREELATLRFSDISGRIGLVTNFEKFSSLSEVKRDSTIGVSRNYSVSGRITDEFNDGDLVRIDITPTFAPGAISGAYQVVDYLPSGLRAVTNLQKTPVERGIHYHLYPSDIEDQKVTFVIWKDFPRPFFYYARVVSKGDYKAEPTLIQSLKSLESANISNESVIAIR